MPTIPEKEAMPLIVQLERLYGPLVKQLNLTEEQSRRFYEVILDDRMKRQTQMTNLLRDEDFSRMARTNADIQKETDANLQALLGAPNFARYQEYQTGIGDRSVLEMMKGDFAESPLTEDQQQHLLKAMESGRNAVGGAVAFSIADSNDLMNEKLGRQEIIDQHILQQAATFLSPVQLQILGSAQARMTTARKKGYAQAQEMFGKHGQKR